MDWEAEIQDPAAHMPQLNNNQYAALAGEEDDEDNDTKSTGVENDSEIKEVRHYEKIIGVHSENEITEPGSTGATEKANEMSLIEEVIA